MPRTARLALSGVPFHVTHRGNRGDPVFRTTDDRWIYLELLHLHAERHDLDIWNYCLMSNHVHLIVRPQRKQSMCRALGSAHGLYAQRFNRRHGVSGHLWANRYYSSALDSAHLHRAALYVELNPVRAGLVSSADEFPWSSARANMARRVEPPLDPRRPWLESSSNWTRYLEEARDGGDDPELRRATRLGRPVASLRGPGSIGARQCDGTVPSYL